MTQHPTASVLPEGLPVAAPTGLPATRQVPLDRRPAGLDAPGPGLARLVRIELRKAVDTVTGRWLLLVTGVLVLGALVLGGLFPPGEQADLHFLLSTALLPVSLLLPVLGVLLLSGEFSTRSALVTFALVPSRGRVVVAKTLAAVLLAVAAVVATAVLTVAAAAVLSATGGLGSWSVEAVVLAQLLLAQVVYVLVGVGFGLLCQSTPLAVVTYLVVPSLLSPVVLLVPALREVGPWVDLSAGTGPLLMSGALTGTQWAQVASVTAIWAAVPFVLGWLRLQRRDLA